MQQRCVLYLRVSDERQVDGFSLAAQERGGRALAGAEGLEIYQVYVDGGQSGTNDQRDAFQQMVADLKRYRVRERITTVIIHKLDRFMRELRLTLNFEHDLKRMKVRLMSVVNTIDTSTPEGRLQFQIEAGLAEYYSNNLSREVKKGLTEKARQGHWVGPVPLGYVKADGKLIPSADAAVIRRIFRMYTSGQHSYTSIADALNADGHRTADRSTQEQRLFGRETIRTIVRNRAYAGYVHSGGVEYAGNHEPLITPVQWDMCTAIRAERERKGGRSSVGGPRYGGILTEIVYCEECGGRMWFHHSGNGQWCYYVCSGRSRRECGVGFVRSTVLEERALALVRSLTLPDHLHARAVSMVRDRQAHAEPATRIIDKTAIESALRRYALIFADGLISEEDYQKKKTYLATQLQAAVDAPPVRPLVNLERAAHALADIGTLVDAATTDERRALLRTLFAALYIEHGEIKAITPTVAYLPLVGVIRELHQFPEYGVADGTSRPYLQAIPRIPQIVIAYHQPYNPAYQ